jgi:hypothetical protein
MSRYDPRKDAYELLGVDPRAGRDEIEAAFRHAALRWHPDKSDAPDAAERFREIQQAAAILRRPGARREYDRLRDLHWKTLRAAERPSGGREGPRPHVPLAPAPPWIGKEVRIVRDSVLFPIPLRHRSLMAEGAKVLAFMSAGAALVTLELAFGLLAIVCVAIMVVQGKPPSSITLAWARLTPGQRLAEFTSADDRAGLVIRHEVPFSALAVAVIERRGAYRVEIRGFPRGGLVLLEPTRDLDWAKRCARDASAWLGLPLARAA